MNKRLFYQPDIPTSVICWSFTLIVFFISMLLWLEITIFQIWTALVLGLFVILVVIQLWRRFITLEDDTVVLHTLIPQNTKRIKFAKIQAVTVRRGQLILKTQFREYGVLLRKADRIQLQQYLTTVIK